MTDRPILFSAPMVLALLDGRKTQTRRALRPQPVEGARFAGVERNGMWLFTKSFTYGQIKPPFGIGDRLWVREEYYQQGHWWQDDTDLTKGGRPKWKFAAYSHEVTFEAPSSFVKARSRTAPGEIRWYKRLGRFMPRRYSWLTLTVTDVRVERLQAICEADAIAEGCPVSTIPGTIGHPLCPVGFNEMGTPVFWYRRLWNYINGAGAWEANPWVVAVSFTVEQRNIDA